MEGGINVAVMPLPPRIRAGCGICLRVSDAEEGPAVAMLAANEIKGTEIYLKTGGGYEKREAQLFP